MVSRRTRTILIVAGIAVVGVGALAVTGEAVAQARIEDRMSSLSAGFPGMSVEPAGGSALGQVLSGHVQVRLTATDAALADIAACRIDQQLTVHAMPDGLVVGTERTLRGMTVPVEVLLVPHRTSDGWTLTADSVSVAGISLPAERVLTALGGDDGLGRRLLDGIPLSAGSLAVEQVDFRAGAVEVTVSAPTDRSSGSGSALGRVRDCLDTASED
ncbi:hypothetical protein [Homoserinibacter sp. GY 40078]|uniref:hypothetical protein n=1 Tax=Homoserinibacter sp. GY 40078 TaxID=2603275 RepID=UPI0011CA0A26|nr:hypothetical protein [Homoserinibacter sp. GY 40078]TXK16362.1 hypothetical protein FVQ89_14020 [Homoserinibacter sp. GY 40078]